MHKRFSFWGLLGLALALVCCLHLPAVARGDLPANPGPRHYDELTFPPLPEITLPAYERYSLPNGLVVYLVEDHHLPLVRGNALFRAGSRWEPAEKVGLAQLTGITMRLGGTQSHPSADLNRLLEQRAAAIETSISTSSGSASFDALSKDTDFVLQLFAEVIQTPAFELEQVALATNQLRGAIARRNDNPSDIASREFSKLLYGAESPYARTVEYSTLGAIQQQNIINFHRTYIRPETTLLGIVGDFDRQQMKALLKKYFGAWRVTTAKPNLAPPSASQHNDDHIFLADQAHLSQSTVLMGQLGGLAKDPDYPALTVMNGVLSGFGGRLFNNIRSQQGLAYSVSGSWQAAYDYPGTFLAGGQTRTETTAQFIQSLRAEIKRLQTSPVSPAELTYAKESILNSFIFRFENPGQTLSRLMTYEYYGYPPDFIFDYQRQVKATTIDQIQTVAQKHLRPETMVTLIVGQEKGLQPQLQRLGSPVSTLDLTTQQAPSP
ncbi:pitrilysin family protein [Synechocystis sp. LKSZ1]|uniref:M16 family metallopeptidase n=1 Tax=Synechocystis sp. LKSZ1 TaxID=3144951 RepID=UPI00336BC08E